MILLTPDQTAVLKSWFLPERPGPLVGSHVIQTGHGVCRVDRWPDPRAVLVETAGNYALLGEPAVLQPADPKPHIFGVVEAAENFEPLLRAAFPDLKVWPRVRFELDTPLRPARTGPYTVRRLEPVDGPLLQKLSPEVNWISKTWGGPAGLASSGYGWGAFAARRLVSVSCTFFLGERYEEIGVVTEARFRGLGLSQACAVALCLDIQQRGHRPSWTTSPDNVASVRVAEKLGFAFSRKDRLYVIRVPIPKPAHRKPVE